MTDRALGGWRPRPDPAVTEPGRRGLRPHRHPPNRLHPWVFDQHQVWVDYWGNEHEIESMDCDYAQNVIAFCRERADRIQNLVVLDRACDLLLSLAMGRLDQAEAVFATLPDTETDPQAWLEHTPLLQALRRRLEGATRSSYP